MPKSSQSDKRRKPGIVFRQSGAITAVSVSTLVRLVPEHRGSWL